MLAKNPFSGFSFYLFAAFNKLEDVHPITFRQISYLVSCRRLGLTLKIKYECDEELKKLNVGKIVTEDFEGEIEKELRVGHISKIMICGPPKMNENVSKFLRSIGQSEESYIIL